MRGSMADLEVSHRSIKKNKMNLQEEEKEK
jgi:hypothetical protein